MIGGIGVPGIGALATRSSATTTNRGDQPAFTLGADDSSTAPTTKSSTKPAPAKVDPGAKLKAALEACRKEASLTPAERARRDVLEIMGLTEDAIDAMTPEDRKAAEEKIAMEVARRMQAAG